MSGLRFRRAGLLFLALAVCNTIASAHIGSPDIYLDANAGPYKLFITVRPPTVIPGVAELEVRSQTSGVRGITAVPLPMSGPGAKFAPVPDVLTVSKDDPQFFTGSLWLMAVGSWQVRINVDGAQGRAAVAIPVPSAALSTKKMEPGLGGLLAGLMVFLSLGLVAIVSAAAREAELPSSVAPDAVQRRRGRSAALVTAVVVVAVLCYGQYWWTSEDRSYSQNVFKPIHMDAQVSGGVLKLMLSDPGWSPGLRTTAPFQALRSLDDLVPDHNHLMHLYVIRQPGLDVVYHLHPELVRTGEFQLQLPDMPAGSYKLYADIVHRNGFPETLVSTIDVPTLHGRPLSGDDAMGTATPWGHAQRDTDFKLPDGYHMQWIRDSQSLKPKDPQLFRFRLVDASGRAPSDMAFYMGMLGHAAFVKTDGSVFAHIHPTGTVSMAAFMAAQQQLVGASSDPMSGMDHSGTHSAASLPNEVGFPYGLPSPGKYRVFVQMKHGATIETGIFDIQTD